MKQAFPPECESSPAPKLRTSADPLTSEQRQFAEVLGHALAKQWRKDFERSNQTDQIRPMLAVERLGD